MKCQLIFFFNRFQFKLLSRWWLSTLQTTTLNHPMSSKQTSELKEGQNVLADRNIVKHFQSLMRGREQRRLREAHGEESFELPTDIGGVKTDPGRKMLFYIAHSLGRWETPPLEQKVILLQLWQIASGPQDCVRLALGPKHYFRLSTQYLFETWFQALGPA